VFGLADADFAVVVGRRGEMDQGRGSKGGSWWWWEEEEGVDRGRVVDRMAEVHKLGRKVGRLVEPPS